jgi:hypothetical protein
MDLFWDDELLELAVHASGDSARLSAAEAQAARAASRLLLASTKTRRAWLWGKVGGASADYIVLQLFNEDPLQEEGDSHYFFSIDAGKTFTQLPPPTTTASRVAILGAPAKAGGVKARVLAGVEARAAATAAAEADRVTGLTPLVQVRGVAPVQSEAPALPEVGRGSITLGELAQLVVGPFTGAPGVEYRISAADAGVTDGAAPGAAFVLQEVERLACLVHDVNVNCAVVPRGAVEQTALGSVGKGVSKGTSAAAAGGIGSHVDPSVRIGVRVNPLFTGLTRAEAGRLTSYFHLRAPRAKPSALERAEGAAAAVDCLEPASVDYPYTDEVARPGAWALRYDGLSDVVYGRSQTHPGALFFHRPATKLFGYVYCGDGTLSAASLPFML